MNNENSTASPPAITMLCTNLRGGAGVAALRLHQALLARGCLSTLFTAHRPIPAPSVVMALPPAQRAMLDDAPARLTALDRSEEQQRAFMRHYPQRDSQREIFSFLTHCTDVERLEDYAGDILHLHWIARMTDPALAPEFFSARPVVWTLHDMQPFTGGCHHADECRNFTEHCADCPHMGAPDAPHAAPTAFDTWRRRKTVYRRMNMHIVCPSLWLAEQARASSLFHGMPVHVIPNCVPVDVFRPLDRAPLRHAFGLDPAACVLIFSANNLAHVRKGGATLLQCMRRLAATPLGRSVRVLLLGGNPSAEFLETGIEVDVMGYIDNEEHLAMLYNAADALILPSMAENLPNVIAESLACGTLPIASAVGGIPEMIRHRETGFLAVPGSVESLLDGVAWVASVKDDPALRRRCRATALEQWSPTQCVASYWRLYEDLRSGAPRPGAPRSAVPGTPPRKMP